MKTPVTNTTSHRKSGDCRAINLSFFFFFFFLFLLKNMCSGTLKNHVVSGLKHRLRVIVRTASMKKKDIDNNKKKINSFLSEKFVFFKT